MLLAETTRPTAALPPTCEKTQPRCGGTSTAGNTGGALLEQVLCDTGLGACPPGSHYPKPGQKVVLKPLPKGLPTMPDPCAGVPGQPVVPQPGHARQRRRPRGRRRRDDRGPARGSGHEAPPGTRHQEGTRLTGMEETIGFDLRSTVSDPSWTADRRTLFLLRHDVASVRSVDTLVWERPPGLPQAPVPEGLWSSLSNLFAAAHALDRADTVAVRITAVEEDEGTPESAGTTGPASERYDLLGYDVADYDRLSGLTNCGYSPEEAASLAPTWAPLLNEWHLFGNPEDATAFAAVTAKRVPEHAPFFAYGIYQLR